MEKIRKGILNPFYNSITREYSDICFLDPKKKYMGSWHRDKNGEMFQITDYINNKTIKIRYKDGTEKIIREDYL